VPSLLLLHLSQAVCLVVAHVAFIESEGTRTPAKVLAPPTALLRSGGGERG
jgi:hypothetical protein